MKKVQFLGVFFLLLTLFAASPQEASAVSLTGSEKELVKKLNPNIAESGSWQRTASGGFVTLTLVQNNITYHVLIYGPSDASWFTVNRNLNLIILLNFDGEGWRFVEQIPIPNGISIHDFCPF